MGGERLLPVNPYVDALVVVLSLRQMFQPYPMLAWAGEPTPMRGHLVRHLEMTKASLPIQRHEHVDVAAVVVNLRRMFQPPSCLVCKMEAMPMSQAHPVYHAPDRKMTGKVSLI